MWGSLYSRKSQQCVPIKTTQTLTSEICKHMENPQGPSPKRARASYQSPKAKYPKHQLFKTTKLTWINDFIIAGSYFGLMTPFNQSEHWLQSLYHMLLSRFLVAAQPETYWIHFNLEMKRKPWGQKFYAECWSMWCKCWLECFVWLKITV